MIINTQEMLLTCRPEQDQEVTLIRTLTDTVIVLDLVDPNDRGHPGLASAHQRDGHGTCVGVMKDSFWMILHAKVCKRIRLI